MKYGGFSLIEFIFVFSIAVVSCNIAIAGLQYFIYTHNGTNTLQQIQQSISLARSIAIARDYQITICPSNNMLILSANNQEFKRFNLSVGANDMLTLYQSGFSNKIVTIQANGMTYNNGHFNYKSKKTNSLPQFNLYFNMALRTYVLISE